MRKSSISGTINPLTRVVGVKFANREKRTLCILHEKADEAGEANQPFHAAAPFEPTCAADQPLIGTMGDNVKII